MEHSKTLSQDRIINMLDSIALQEPDKALSHYRRLCNENPQALKLLSKFYQSLFDMFRFEELLEYAESRLALAPEDGLSLSWKVHALRYMSQDDIAISALESALKRNPNDYTSFNTLGILYKGLGDFDTANKYFNRAIACKTDDVEAYWNQSDISQNSAADLESIQQLMSRPSLSENNKSILCFSAYRHAEKLGNYVDAFKYLQHANRLQRDTIEYKVDQDIAINTAAKAIFDHKFMHGLAPLIPTDSTIPAEARPIFIMGMPRSGTTLVEQIIASHSLVNGGDEYTALANAISTVQAKSILNGSVADWVQSCTPQTWQLIGKTYLHNARFIRGDKNIHTDKNQFNYRSIGIIKASLPNAKIVIVDRNPMDVGFGCYRQFFGQGGVKFSYSMDDLAKMYASHQNLINHWKATTDGLILQVKYEELVRQPKQGIENILAFCGLPIEDGCFDFHKTKRSVKTLSAAQVRQPMSDKGIGRWRRYEQQLQPLMDALEKQGITDLE